MSKPLPTHEVVASFPAEIKAGLVRLPVRMHGGKQLLIGSEAVMAGIVASLVECGVVPPTPKPDGATAMPRDGRGRPATREYWRRMRALRIEYDYSPRITGNLRTLAEKYGVAYGSTFTAFKQIREGRAPFPDEEPEAPRTPLSKPNGKLL